MIYVPGPSVSCIFGESTLVTIPPGRTKPLNTAPCLVASSTTVAADEIAVAASSIGSTRRLKARLSFIDDLSWPGFQLCHPGPRLIMPPNFLLLSCFPHFFFVPSDFRHPHEGAKPGSSRCTRSWKRLISSDLSDTCPSIQTGRMKGVVPCVVPRVLDQPA